MGIKEEVLTVKKLGDRIGYGNMIALASSLWRKLLKESGVPESGAFIPCCSCSLSKREMKFIQKELDIADSHINATFEKELGVNGIRLTEGKVESCVKPPATRKKPAHPPGQKPAKTKNACKK